MGARGPRPAPTATKQARGTARPDRLNPTEPQPPAADPNGLSAWLPDREPARRAWSSIAPMLAELGVLATTDRVALVLLCDALAEYVALRDAIAAMDEHAALSGHVYETETKEGSIMRRPEPLLAQRDDAWDRVLRMAKEFGMTPSARTGVHATPPDEKDPFGAFLGDSHSNVVPIAKGSRAKAATGAR